MGLPKIRMPEGGMLDGIKSKLGFSEDTSSYSSQRSSRRRDYGDYDDEPDYGDYGDYGDYEDEEADDAPGSNYDPYSSVTTRPARGSHARTSSGYTSPKLVSFDDVRAHTTVPESLNRDPLPPRRSTSYRSERTVVDSDAPAHANTPNARIAAASDRERNESLNSLFTGAESSKPAASSAPAPANSVSPAASSGATRPLSAVAPRPAAATAAPAVSTVGAIRALAVVKPTSYSEVEKISRALKAGNVVVLALSNTPDALAKRVLDFSFGASSVLGANVDCVADKVFVIAHGAALMESERASLRSQGIL